MLEGVDPWAVASVLFLALMIAFIVIGAVAIILAILYSKKETPVQLYGIDDYERNCELAQQICPPEVLGHKIGLMGTAEHIKAKLGIIKGLKVIGYLHKGQEEILELQKRIINLGKSPGNSVQILELQEKINNIKDKIQNESDEVEDIILCVYRSKTKNEWVDTIMKKPLENIVFSISDCDGLIGDIGLNGVNIVRRGKYNILATGTVSAKLITALVDNQSLEDRVAEVYANQKNLVQYAIRSDPRHHKTMEESASMAQSGQSSSSTPGAGAGK